MPTLGNLKGLMAVFLGLFLSACAATVQPPAPDLNRPWGGSLPLPGELRSALEQGRVDFLPGPDGLDIPVRIFGEQGRKTPVVMSHGLQSHSGWFAQSAAFLAGLGHPVYSMDRQGAGLSRAPRGDTKDFLDWAADIHTVVLAATARHGTEQVYTLGHCFGAIPATVFADEYPHLVKGLILTTPAIYTRTSVSFGEALKILFSPSGSGDFLVPVPLDPEWFSELDEYEAFIAVDPLALQAASGDFYWETHQARKHLRKQTGSLAMPVFMGVAGEDPISDSEKNREWFGEIPSPIKTLITYEDARHVLEFSLERDRYFQDLSHWMAWIEAREVK